MVKSIWQEYMEKRGKAAEDEIVSSTDNRPYAGYNLVDMENKAKTAEEFLKESDVKLDTFRAHAEVPFFTKPEPEPEPEEVKTDSLTDAFKIATNYGIIVGQEKDEHRNTHEAYKIGGWHFEKLPDGTVGMYYEGDKEDDVDKLPPFDEITKPAGYQRGGIETIEVIKLMLTPQEYEGYLKGNILKYRERAGHKPGVPAEKDYAKAREYKRMLDEHLKEQKDEEANFWK